MARCRIALVLALGLAAGCGGDEPRDRVRVTAPGLHGGSPPGRLVAIGGGRSLFVHCAGTGRPAVVLEAGGGASGFFWRDVQPQLARSTQVCAYDRAGNGSTVAPPGVRNARQELADLRRLLSAARVDPPYVLVGHSYGGVLARAFAHESPGQTAGLVLVDTLGRDARRRMLAIWPASQAPETRRQLATTLVDNVDLAVGERIAGRIQALGDTPLAVVEAALQDNLARTRPGVARALRRLVSRMHGELARLSRNSLHVVALRSHHEVPTSSRGQPAVVVSAVRAVVRAARDDARLPPCPRIFSGPDVRCR